MSFVRSYELDDFSFCQCFWRIGCFHTWWAKRLMMKIRIMMMTDLQRLRQNIQRSVWPRGTPSKRWLLITFRVILIMFLVPNEASGAPTTSCISSCTHPAYNPIVGVPKSLWDTNHGHFTNLLPWMSHNCGRTSPFLLMLHPGSTYMNDHSHSRTDGRTYSLTHGQLAFIGWINSYQLLFSIYHLQ